MIKDTIKTKERINNAMGKITCVCGWLSKWYGDCTEYFDTPFTIVERTLKWDEQNPAAVSLLVKQQQLYIRSLDLFSVGWQAYHGKQLCMQWAVSSGSDDTLRCVRFASALGSMDKATDRALKHERPQSLQTGYITLFECGMCVRLQGWVSGNPWSMVIIHHLTSARWCACVRGQSINVCFNRLFFFSHFHVRNGRAVLAIHSFLSAHSVEKRCCSSSMRALVVFERIIQLEIYASCSTEWPHTAFRNDSGGVQIKGIRHTEQIYEYLCKQDLTIASCFSRFC